MSSLQHVTAGESSNLNGPSLTQEPLPREHPGPERCAICLGRLYGRQSSSPHCTTCLRPAPYTTTLQCGHTFHWCCMINYLGREGSACPLCRTSITVLHSFDENGTRMTYHHVPQNRPPLIRRNATDNLFPGRNVLAPQSAQATSNRPPLIRQNATDNLFPGRNVLAPQSAQATSNRPPLIRQNATDNLFPGRNVLAPQSAQATSNRPPLTRQNATDNLFPGRNILAPQSAQASNGDESSLNAQASNRESSLGSDSPSPLVNDGEALVSTVQPITDGAPDANAPEMTANANGADADDVNATGTSSSEQALISVVGELQTLGHDQQQIMRYYHYRGLSSRDLNSLPDIAEDEESAVSSLHGETQQIAESVVSDSGNSLGTAQPEEQNEMVQETNTAVNNPLVTTAPVELDARGQTPVVGARAALPLTRSQRVRRRMSRGNLRSLFSAHQPTEIDDEIEEYEHPINDVMMHHTTSQLHLPLSQLAQEHPVQISVVEVNGEDGTPIHANQAPNRNLFRRAGRRIAQSIQRGIKTIKGRLIKKDIR
ncbi:peroxisome biogenesis factor 10 [Ciborinia camelliae]|nr:peroxisome biogenesis factor 10 [Ciborinia camelliae]